MHDYKLLEALDAVIEHGTFDKAARFLHITQSAVSQRIRQLEEQTGNILLIRSSPPKPTEEGLRFIRHLQQVKHLEKLLDEEFTDGSQEAFTSISLALNADSIGTWFFSAVAPFLQGEKVTLDLHSADQEQTHTLLKHGQVLSFIGTQEKAFQGCRRTFLGSVRYGLFCSNEFYTEWFHDGFTVQTASRAPAIFFNRSDKLNHHIFQKLFKHDCSSFNIFYLPSTELFQQFVVSGFGYGALPEQQSIPLVEKKLITTLDDRGYVDVDLYFHCWNLQSPPLLQFERQLLKSAKTLLRQPR